MSFFFLFSFFFHFKDVEIALVGKYTKLEDAYASVIKALNHASLALNHRLRQENISRRVVLYYTCLYLPDQNHGVISEVTRVADFELTPQYLG